LGQSDYSMNHLFEYAKEEKSFFVKNGEGEAYMTDPSLLVVGKSRTNMEE